MPFAHRLAPLVPFHVRRAALRLIGGAREALIRDIAPAARRIGQAVQTIAVLMARTVLIRLQVLEGEDLRVLRLLVVHDLHLARVSVTRGHHPLRLEV